jgi:hypothetical protein
MVDALIKNICTRIERAEKKKKGTGIEIEKNTGESERRGKENRSDGP